MSVAIMQNAKVQLMLEREPFSIRKHKVVDKQEKMLGRVGVGVGIVLFCSFFTWHLVKNVLM